MQQSASTTHPPRVRPSELPAIGLYVKEYHGRPQFLSAVANKAKVLGKLKQYSHGDYEYYVLVDEQQVLARWDGTKHVGTLYFRSHDDIG